MFQVSRVPVRDALQMLISTGIAVNVPRRGVIVRPVSRQSLDDLFEVRKILEGAAIEIVLANATGENRRRLEQLVAQQTECLRDGDVKRQAALDDEFHRTLYEVVTNARLVELIFANWEMIKQARSASTVMPAHGKAWIASSLRRHKRLLAALKKRGADAVRDAVFENIESSKREIVSCLRELAWIEAGSGAPAAPRRRAPGKRA
jgi:DNA-binding GntR family transcriptional regulator